MIQQETIIVPPQPTVVKIVRNSSQRETNQINSIKNEVTVIKSEEQQWQEPAVFVVPP